ncbi:ABC transporter permease [Spongiactinospora sp. TRM90649]|uniref:ABC transporter permease n=1 Tax=Spongiactinospora sp. TRM90649 TaxID=3031114 RepID=UPI0023F7DC9D|nr:ABC transporter permease [Spongiactinospora sp. TRM90649]MDF5752456.1 ABC transporter permease [Spongiactinospora sp. TRM90649]
MSQIAFHTAARRRLAWEARAAVAMWRRELLHFLRDPARLLLLVAQPVLYLTVLGTGLGALIPSSPGAGDYRTYLFPGVLVIALSVPAAAAGASLAGDREAGVLREMLVAPVHRAALLSGRIAGGATIATCQGAMVLALAGVADVPYHPALLAKLVIELGLIAFTMTALVTLLAVTVTRAQTLHAALGLTLTPMIFLSGALFPMSGLPSWLAAPARADPLTYVVEPLRQTIAPYLETRASLSAAGSTVAREMAVTALIGVLALLLAVRRVSRPG